ncbi:relaxase/mobilization nuclease domain-containing protein [Roseibium aggregatum]|uniref:relaxase/mobilization nuclease domain-containing protein n=1 Tax=Roseibium aggregatum TaxID=187304 RepID=UPI001E5F907B|nr:relaxase [Roseibium aggregatum]UES36715.1 relaxase [Roseibium aggregatum]
MILKASQRGGGAQLAHHLLRTDENDHVQIHEIRGFVASDLHGAFKEAHAISRGTRCRQFLFSLSLSPPERESVPVEVFEGAIKAVEDKIGLSGQPRAIVFHEKEGRRHAHCVWSRIDADSMKAINLPHFKWKLQDISRQLYLENDWQMPRGLVNAQEKNPLNFTLVEWQQAKRARKDPRAIKGAFQDCWAISDSLKGFSGALRDRGYYLARGDRRGFVAIDWQGEVYAVPRMIGKKAKDVKARLGDPATLPSVDEMREQIETELSGKLKEIAEQAAQRHDGLLDEFNTKRRKLSGQQLQARQELEKAQKSRSDEETKARASRLPRGLKALFFRLTGKYRAIKKCNETEAAQGKQRDNAEMQKLIDQHLQERRQLQEEKKLILHRVSVLRRRIELDMRNFPQSRAANTSKRGRGRKRSR